MIITVKNLSYFYPKNKDKKVLENLNLSLESGKIYILTGKNGSGKTTLGKLITGLIKPPKDSVYIDGADVSGMSVGAVAKKIGYVFQNPELQFFANSVSEELTFPYEFENRLTDEILVKIDAVIKSFNLETLKDRLPLTLSGGEKQRLALAVTAVRDTDFLIMDEPTSALDVDGREYLKEYIDGYIASGKGALIITHEESFFSHAGAVNIRMTEGGFCEI